jgi:hypothetical protein
MVLYTVDSDADFYVQISDCSPDDDMIKHFQSVLCEKIFYHLCLVSKRTDDPITRTKEIGQDFQSQLRGPKGG